MLEMFRLWRRFASSRASAPYGRALTLLRKGKSEQAETELTALLEQASLAQERAYLFNKRGVARVKLRQRDLARADFNAAADCIDGYAPALTNLANLLLEDGDAEAAIARYERAIRADPNYALAHLNLGAAYKRLGRLDDAVRALRRALALENSTSAFRRRPR
jgi:tetratricopeptide (TPR) repeat protein